MRILITGGTGLLGTDLVDSLRRYGHEVHAPSREALDITKPIGILWQPDVVINCAAYTDVDGAETHQAQAESVNSTGAINVATCARRLNARMVQISTDYVFPGTYPYPYTTDHAVAPINNYGLTKATAEEAVRLICPDHLIIRTAWLYGAHGRCFPRTLLNRWNQGQQDFQVVHDQYGQPTWTMDVARIIRDLLNVHAPPGTYHATSTGKASWFTFAQMILPHARITPVPTREVPRPATRPASSLLDSSGLSDVGVLPIGSLRERWLWARETAFTKPIA